MSLDDFNTDEREADEAAARRLAEAERRARLIDLALNAFLCAVVAILAAAVLIAYARCRADRLTERERIREVCPSGTAQRVIDEINRKPLVAFCNRVADFVFGTTPVTEN